jgi:hypothetical protein
MRTFAYCCASFADATRRAAGVAPATCPPVSAATFNPAWLNGDGKRAYQLIYFDLHGEHGSLEWYGDVGMSALTVEHVRAANLGGAVVFALNCFLADQDSPMMDALLAAGARYVIGGEGKNWAGKLSLFGASLLGRWFRLMLRVGYEPLDALRMAKQRVQLSLLGQPDRVAAAKDTLEFKAYYKA